MYPRCSVGGGCSTVEGRIKLQNSLNQTGKHPAYAQCTGGRGGHPTRKREGNVTTNRNNMGSITPEEARPLSDRTINERSRLQQCCFVRYRCCAHSGQYYSYLRSKIDRNPYNDRATEKVSM